MKKYIVMAHEMIRTEGGIIDFILSEYTGIKWNRKSDAEHEAALARHIGIEVYIKELK